MSALRTWDVRAFQGQLWTPWVAFTVSAHVWPQRVAELYVEQVLGTDKDRPGWSVEVRSPAEKGADRTRWWVKTYTMRPAGGGEAAVLAKAEPR